MSPPSMSSQRWPSSMPTSSMRSNSRRVKRLRRSESAAGGTGRIAADMVLFYLPSPSRSSPPQECRGFRRPRPSHTRLANEIDGNLVGNNAHHKAEIEQFLRGFRNHIAGIDRVMVDVHADELLRQTRLHIARKLQ